MKCNRAIVLLAGLVLLLGFGAPAFAGTQEPECKPIEIEINALRGGSPTVESLGTKDITAKARIRKGTAEVGTFITNTTLTITAYDPDGLYASHQESTGIILEVGKGGDGDKLTMDVPPCDPGETVSFTARFVGTAPNTAICDSLESEPLFKTCK